MARRLGSHGKPQRVLEFLQGLSYPEIAARMQQCGFREEDRRRAWELLAAYCNQRYVAHLPRANTGQLVREADAFENRYFPIAQATLEANFPAIAALVLRNLRRTNDRRVLVELAVFLERIRQLDLMPIG
jgi:hypothetical protein